MIIRGGENIQPTEIENFICTHPKIQDCYVIGVPSLRLGEAVAAYAKLKENETMEISELTDYCKTGLARIGL
jgi:fatty-acyl-CoA synthase